MEFLEFHPKALALLCSLCVICGATMSRPEGLQHTLESDTLTTTTTTATHHQQTVQDTRPKGALVLLLGSDLANSPLLSSFLRWSIHLVRAFSGEYLTILYIKSQQKNTKAKVFEKIASRSSKLPPPLLLP